jgi:ubiquinone/menaquinone biosynthesis C-methylase UbiE/uncharacterized protein YbaR (Trm112 family)
LGQQETVPAVSSPADLILCPRCRTGSSHLALVAEESQLRCPTCATSYPIRDGVIDLLPEMPTKRTLAQAAMESDAIVRIYESRLWRRSWIVALALGISFEREQQLILEASSPPADGTVLDLACGPGIYARPLARSVPGGTVVGLDLSLPMLRYARRRADAEGVDNLVLVRASAMDIPLPDGRFDAVNCCGALHLFPDAGKALREVGRVLKAGGSFTTAAFRQPGGRKGPEVNSLRRNAFGIHAFSDGEIERLLADAGFESPRVLHTSMRWLAVAAQRAA